MNTKLRTRDLTYIALSAALIAVCSWISIPTTVPFTLQFTVTAAAWQTLTLTNPTAAAVSYGDLRTTVQRVV